MKRKIKSHMCNSLILASYIYIYIILSKLYYDLRANVGVIERSSDTIALAHYNSFLWHWHTHESLLPKTQFILIPKD